ncbi:MAG: ATP-binding cassette domain-containing protein [Actinobacteria bacterium]|nr:ATP-binding cassette domain-containing protein [Actinomycetota bacterium]
MAIVAQGLGKSFGSVRAVDDLSFEVPDGVVTGFLGPNGAGKSTTMRLMLGLDRGAGSTLFDGKPLIQHPHASEVVGTHLDARPFLPGRTAHDHLRMLATDAKLPKSRIEEVLAMVGLTDVADKRPKGFSLGMAQRLGLAGAVLANPRALMLDEPANGLDPQSIQWLREFLRAYAAQGNAVLVSSHLLTEMQLMAQHVVVIAKGSLVADGTINELVSQRSDVLVRSADSGRLADALRGAGVQVDRDGDDGLAVTGLTTDEIGRLAFDAGIALRELTQRKASLEDTFLELTGDAQDFAFGESS